jgi:pyruvate/2-oxoglutarate dehydrogenase complex dihydrolipoamide acyltransferase (E2) component
LATSGVRPLEERTMTLLALLLALAQQPAQPTNSAQDQTVGQTEPDANTAHPKKSTSSNSTDKAESLSTEHNTDLQGGPASGSAKHGKKSAKNTKAAKSKKAQGRSAKPLPEASQPPSSENATGNVEREPGQGKGRQQPKPLGEKADQ